MRHGLFGGGMIAIPRQERLVPNSPPAPTVMSPTNMHLAALSLNRSPRILWRCHARLLFVQYIHVSFPPVIWTTTTPDMQQRAVCTLRCRYHRQKCFLIAMKYRFPRTADGGG